MQIQNASWAGKQKGSCVFAIAIAKPITINLEVAMY